MSGSLKGPSDSFESFQRQDDTTKKGLCLLELRHTEMVQWGVSRQVEPADECGEDIPQPPSAIVKEEHEEDEQTVSDESILLSELRKRKRPLSTQHGQSKTRQYDMKRKTNTSLKHKQIKQENSTPSRKRNFKERWPSDRYKLAENHMLEIMKAEGAVFEKPISRPALRTASRRLIGDTGLLDHLLKHIDGRVAPGGTERFRRCYNTDGIMEYWLESADMVKIKHEAGIPDPWWKPGSTIPFRDSVSSGELTLLKEEISILKRNMEEQVSKKEQDQSNQIGKVNEELVRWRGKTDQDLMGIASSLSGVQDIYKELVTWKSKTEQQIAEITDSLSNMQAPKQCTDMVSPTSERWEDWLANPNLDNVHGEDFGPWLEGADVANVRKDTSMQELCTITQPWLKPCDVTAQDPICAREMGMLKDEMTKMKRESQELILKRMEEDQVNMTPDSSVTANSKLELDNSLLLFQEMCKEMMKWKAKMEQQIVEISNAVSILQASRQYFP